jgi:hypothetical protein
MGGSDRLAENAFAVWPGSPMREWTTCPKLIDLIGDSFQAHHHNATLLTRDDTRFAPFSECAHNWMDLLSPSQYILTSPD